MQLKTKSEIKIHCKELENHPVSHKELVVIETYANDLILGFIRDNKNLNMLVLLRKNIMKTIYKVQYGDNFLDN